MTDLFTRHGTPHTGPHHVGETGRPYTTAQTSCSRCGGAGGSDRWAHTGWTCFQCGGHGRGPVVTVKLYTAEQVAKLDASAAKRQAKKTAAADARAVAAKAEADARRVAFLAEHGALIEQASKYVERSTFIADVVRKGLERSALSQGQVDALRSTVAKIEASDAAKAASRHVGAIGERLTLAVTVERVTSYDRQAFGGFNMETVWIVTMRAENGAAIVSKSPRFAPQEGERFTLKATVKEHGDYRGEAQTIVQRPAVVEIKAAA
jgi:hypothetical protein